MQKIKARHLIVTAFFGLVFLALPHKIFAATLALSPSSQSVSINNTFTISVILDTAGQPVYGVDVYSLHFDPTILQVQDADSNTAGIQIQPGTLMTDVQYNTVDNTAGTIQFSQTASAAGGNYTGVGTLATITFKAIKTGTSNATFDFTPGSTTDTNVASLYSDLLTAVTNGTYTVNPGSDTTAPSVPTGVAATSTSSTTATVSWTASTDPAVAGQTTSGVAGYKIYRGGVQVGTSTTATFGDTGLSAATTYSYTVAAYDNAGNVSAQSSAAAATTLAASDTTSPSAPSGVIAAATSAYTTTVTWTASTDPTVAGQTTSGVGGYQIFRCQGTNCNATTQVGTSTTPSFNDTGLAALTAYRYRIKAYDQAGNISGFSSSASVTTTSDADVTAPSVPATITAQVISATQVNLSWAASTDAVVAGQVTSGLAGYKIYRGSSQVATSSTLSYNDTNLSAGTSYSYTVAAYDNAGNTSVQSSSVVVTTQSLPDTTAPTVTISSPSSGASLSGTVTFAATASDPIIAGQTNSGLALITLSIDGTVYATTTAGSLSTTVDTTKLTNATHVFSATARDNAGNTSTAATASVTIFNLSTATRYPRKFTLTGLEGISSLSSYPTVTATVLTSAGGTVLETQTLSADVTGTYTVTFLPSDTQVVNLRVNVSGYLTRLLSSIDTTVNSGTPLSVPQLLAGDFNSDNVINSLDYSVLNSHWLGNFATADINKDGLVNSLDYAIFKNNYAKIGE